MRMRGIYEGGFDVLRISLNLYNSVAEVQRVLEVGASAQKASTSKSIATQSPRKAPVSAHNWLRSITSRVQYMIEGL